MKRPPDPNNWEPTRYRHLEPGEQKIPPLSRGEAFVSGLVLLPLFGLGAVLRWLRLIR